MRKLSTRSKSRTVAAFLAVTVLAAVVGVSLVRSWSELSRQRAFITAERAGIAYLRPLAILIGALTAAEASAVRGKPIDTSGLRTAMAGMAAVESEHGGLLGTGDHWSDLQQLIDTLSDRPSTGASAYQDFGDVVSVAIQLQVHVGDVSNLVLDAELDTHHLLDAGLRLPTVLLNAARAADLAALPLGDETPGERAVAVAVARYEVAVAAAQISAGLKRSILNTERSALGTELTSEHDAFQNAVDALTPPALVRQFSGPAPEAGLDSSAARVNSAAVALADAIWGQLDALLADRQAGKVEEQRLIIVGAAAVLACLLLLSLVAPNRRSRTVDEEADESFTTAPEPPQISLIDARDLLGTDELVHVGRAVQARPRERDRAE